MSILVGAVGQHAAAQQGVHAEFDGHVVWIAIVLLIGVAGVVRKIRRRRRDGDTSAKQQR